MGNRVFISGAVFFVVLALGVACVAEAEGRVLVNVRVLTDEPPILYQLIEGTPSDVGVYEFYLERSDIPGSGVFKKLDSIALEKVRDNEFYGRKAISKIDGTLCVGYPPTNFIDGAACVKIDQSQKEVNVIVHYWKTGEAISQGK